MRSSETQVCMAWQGHRHVPISDGVGVGKCSTGLYLYEPKSDGFGSPPRCRRCRANDDSITQAEPRFSLYRDNPAEVGGTARSWRPETHVDTRPRARAHNAWPWIRTLEPVPSTSFLFSLFFFRRIRLSALLDTRGETRMANICLTHSRESQTKKVRRLEPTRKRRMQLPPTVGHSLPRCRTIVSFPSRIYQPAGRFCREDTRASKLCTGETLVSREFRGTLDETRDASRVAIRVTRDIGSKCYWHVSDHFCVEVIDVRGN